MRIFTNKSIWKKIVIALLIVLLFQVVVMKPVHADVVEFAGKLMSPILSLLVSIGDGINDIIARSVMGQYATLYNVDMLSSFWEGVLTALVAAVFAIGAIALVIFTGGVAAAVVGITATVVVGTGTVIAGLAIGTVAAVWFNDQVLPDDLYIPLYTYSAEEIFKGNILLFDVDFFSDGEKIYAYTEDGTNINISDYDNFALAEERIQNHGGAKYYYYLNDNGDEVKTSNQNTAVALKGTISSWYNALRNICIVLMLSVLVYIGIRILLSSVASDKAKYLTMLKDWFIGLCLLFLMHYIMAFSVTLVEKLTEVVKAAIDQKNYIVVLEDANGKLEKAAGELGVSDLIQENSEGMKFLNWPTNLMGSLRLQLQMEQYGAHYVGLCICFLMLCLFTLYFTVVYLKRVLYMAFLTMIAPVVALTYCIDKLNDGKAQGFDRWFKEYIFNLLIQPMHLLLYYILVTSAFELASVNVIYSIVAIGFMIPAEKLLRSFFGFEKANTAPALGPAGAMMAASALTHFLHKGTKGKGKGEGNGGKSDDEEDKIPIHNKDNPINAFVGDSNEQTSTSSNSDEHTSGPANPDEHTPGPGNSDEQTSTGEDTQTPRWSPELSQEQIDDLRADGVEPGSQEYDQAMRQFGIDPSTGTEESTQQEGSTPSTPSEETTTPTEAEEGATPPNTTENSGEIRLERAGETATDRSYGAGRRIRRMAYASWAAQKAAMRAAPRKFKRKLENSHPIRAVGKIAAGAALGTAAGAAGLAIAATTGDLGNVAKVGGGAAAGGYALGSRRAQNRQSPMQDKKIQEVRDDAYNKGDKGEYKQDAMNDYVKNYVEDVRNRNYFEQKFGSKKAKEMLQRGGIVEKCLYGEITDRKEIAAVQKLVTKEGKSAEQAISIAQLGQMTGDTTHMTQKRRDEWGARIEKMAVKSGVKDTKAFAEERISDIDKFYDFKK